MKKIISFKFKYLIAAALAVIVALSAGLLSRSFGANAQGAEYTPLIPKTPLETFALSYPTHAYSDGRLTAITTADKKLFLSFDGETPQQIIFANELGQIARFNEYLLYRENQSVYALKLDDTAERLPLTYKDSVDGTQNLNCNYSGCFSNGETLYFAVCVEDKLQIFGIAEDAENKPAVTLLPFFADDNSVTIKKAPVAVNSKSVFYISQDNKLCRRDLNALWQSPVQYGTISPTAMIADEENVYCIADNNIYRFIIADNSAAPTSLAAQSEYGLGKFSAPADIAFKNGNLLITDGTENGSVQEFSINGDALEFTGFAVASGLSAYNRVAENPSDVRVSGETVAALDCDKITVINAGGDFNPYEETRFTNIPASTAPALFALGDNSFIYFDGNALYGKELGNGTATELIVESRIKSVCYQSGYYYAGYSDGTDATVIRFSEKTFEETERFTFNGVAPVVLIAADVLGGVYVYDGHEIIKLGETETIPITNAVKIAFDLSGKLFALTDGEIKVYENGEWTRAFAAETEICAFGISFESKKLYFALKDTEGLFYTENAGNSSLADVEPSADYYAATLSVKPLELYRARAGANAYYITEENGAFVYNGRAEITDADEGYPLFTVFSLNGELTLYAFASGKGVILIDERELTAAEPEYLTAPETVRVITPCKGYALPVVTKDYDFALNDGDGLISLNKDTVITVEMAFSVLGEPFYKATAERGLSTVEFYIHAGFCEVETTEFDTKTYAFGTLKKTALYADEELTAVIGEAQDGETVKIIERKSGCVKIALTLNGNETEVYVPAAAVKNPPNATVKNVLILLAVVASACGTVTYFLLRRKNS